MYYISIMKNTLIIIALMLSTFSMYSQAYSEQELVVVLTKILSEDGKLSKKDKKFIKEQIKEYRRLYPQKDSIDVKKDTIKYKAYNPEDYNSRDIGNSYYPLGSVPKNANDRELAPMPYVTRGLESGYKTGLNSLQNKIASSIGLTLQKIVGN